MIRRYKNLLFGIIIGLLLGIGYSELYDINRWSRFKTDSENIQICFTPPSGCTEFIAKQIEQSQESIYLQAYGLTSKVIIDELIEASRRGVKVKAILDRSNFSEKKSVVENLRRAGIEVIRDKVLGIAHNKIIILDKITVVTGSFNFTEAADKRNSENVVVIHDKKIAEKYMNNWVIREKLSRY